MALGAVAHCDLAAAETWVELTPPGPLPAPRENASMTYDPVGHRLILFGGQTTTVPVNDVWSFDLASETWTDITPAAGPAPVGRFTQNALYDPVEHRMLIWSGHSPSDFLNDVWEFDLSTHTWSEYTPSGPEPNIRYGTAAVLDPVTRDLVTFAGFTNEGRFDDTWRFDIDGGEWTDATPPSGSPMERCLHSAAYDILNRKMIMYGGQNMGGLDDIWALDLSAGSWTELTPAIGPTGRYFVAMDYDSTRHRIVVEGGFSPPGGATDEVWEFDLASETWTELFPTGSGPTPRSRATANYLVAEDRLIVFGGRAATMENDLWSLEFSPDGDITMPWSITGAGNEFSWPVPANVTWVRGDLALVGTYAFEVSAPETHATSFTDTSVPLAGEGYYYLVRFQGAEGSWQTSAGAEPDRDSTLP